MKYLKQLIFMLLLISLLIFYYYLQQSKLFSSKYFTTFTLTHPFYIKTIAYVNKEEEKKLLQGIYLLQNQMKNIFYSHHSDLILFNSSRTNVPFTVSSDFINFFLSRKNYPILKTEIFPLINNENIVSKNLYTKNFLNIDLTNLYLFFNTYVKYQYISPSKYKVTKLKPIQIHLTDKEYIIEAYYAYHLLLFLEKLNINSFFIKFSNLVLHQSYQGEYSSKLQFKNNTFYFLKNEYDFIVSNKVIALPNKKNQLIPTASLLYYHSLFPNDYSFKDLKEQSTNLNIPISIKPI